MAPNTRDFCAVSHGVCVRYSLRRDLEGGGRRIRMRSLMIVQATRRVVFRANMGARGVRRKASIARPCGAERIASLDRSDTALYLTTRTLKWVLSSVEGVKVRGFNPRTAPGLPSLSRADLLA